MKRLIFVLFIPLLCSSLLLAQLQGHGKRDDPYYGTITQNTNWGPYLPDGITPNPDYPYDININGVMVVYVCNTDNPNIEINSGITLTLSTSSQTMEMATEGAIMTVSGTFNVESWAEVTAYEIDIAAGGVLDIGPFAFITPTYMVNDGTVRLNSDELGIASLNASNYLGTGIAEEEIFLTGGIGAGGHLWHYISTPISGVSTNVFTTNPSTSNLAQYIEPLVYSDNSVGWVAYDGYTYNPVGSIPAYGFTSLLLGIGYNYYCSDATTRTFSGQLNNSNRSVTLTCGTGYPNSQGFNLIGNPFACSLNWDLIAPNLPSKVDDAIYFTTQDGVASYVNGSGVGSEYPATGLIPPMQGFFVHVNTPTGGTSITLRTSAKTHDYYYQTRYKGDGQNGKSSNSFPLVRLKFENQKISDDLILRFNQEATNSVDKKFDAYKFSKTGKTISTWTKTGNIDYSINTLPFPETSVEVPVGIYASEAGIYKLSSNELKNLDDYSITLKDISTNITVDLKKGGIMVFNAPAGITEGRFILTVANITTSVTEINLPVKKFSIYSSRGTVNILSLTDEFNNIPGSVNIYDLTGRIVMQVSNVEWQNNGELRQINLNPAEQGLYIVEIKAGNKKYVEKVNMNK
jgi:hypothetical protein